MAKQTIIVMRTRMETAPLLKLLKKKYLGQVDGIFHNGDSELKKK